MIFAAIKKATEMQMGYDVIPVLEENMSLKKLQQLIHTRNFDALLVTGIVWWVGERIDFLIQKCADRPLVWMGAASAPWPIPTCCIDYFQASYRTTSRALGYGYKRVALVVPNYVPKPVKTRLFAGFFAALDFSDHMFSELIFEYETERGNDVSIPSMKEKKRFQKWLAKTKPDAITCLHLDLKSLLPELGYKIPEDIAYADFDLHSEIDGEVAGLLPLHDSVGSTAIELLDIQMRRNESLNNHTIPSCSLSAKWVDGKSMPRLSPDLPRVLN
jgi:DNA-binding LacI/PurR family transcriptional regulator